MASASRRFTPASRLREAREFKHVFARPFRSSSATLTILARANGLAEPRLGLAIAKKHVRRAVDRNRVKRVVREHFRLHSEGIGGLDIIVLARRGLAEQTRPELRAGLERHWRRLEGVAGDSVPSC